MNSTPQPPEAQMMQFILSKWISKPINVAAELGLADLLADGPLSAAELADRSHCHAPSLYRLLRALACVGIFCQHDDERFELTPLGACLRKDAMGPLAKMFQAKWHNRAWDELLYGVQTGEVAFDKAHGESIFSFFKHNPQAADVFNQANAGKAARVYQALVKNYDFTGIDLLVDMGGGVGTLMVQVLCAFPEMQGVLAEQAEVALDAQKMIQKVGISNRCQVVTCDFFEAVPPGGDAYLMANILHDWEDEACTQILKNCRHAIQPGGKILVLDGVINAGNDFSIVKLLDLEVFVMGGGRERSENEFKILFESTGFELTQVLPIDDSVALIEGIRR
jgi:hypothetical protein